LLYDPEAGVLLQEMETAHDGQIGQLLSFPPTEARGEEHCWVVSCGNDGRVKVWLPEARGLSLLHVLGGHAVGPVRGAMYDGIHIATVSAEDGTIRLENAETGALIGVIAGEGRTPIHCAASYELPDGRWRLVTGESDGIVKVWNPDGGGLLRRLVGHAGAVYCLHIFESKDGVYGVASGDSNGVVCVFDLQDHAPPRGLLLRPGHKR
jgi:WD40 repeat protein